MNIFLDNNNLIYGVCNVQDSNSLYHLHVIYVLILFFILFVSLNLATNLLRKNRKGHNLHVLHVNGIILIFLNNYFNQVLIKKNIINKCLLFDDDNIYM